MTSSAKFSSFIEILGPLDQYVVTSLARRPKANIEKFCYLQTDRHTYIHTYIHTDFWLLYM